MKTTIKTLGLACALSLGAPVAAHAQSTDGAWFINGNVGQVSIDDDLYNGEDTGYAVNGGYRWAVSPSAAIGVEIGYNDLGNIDVSNAFDDDPVLDENSSDLHGWTAGVNGRLNFTPDWYASARAGVYQWRGHGLSNDDDPLRKGLDETDWYTGVGFGYNFSSQASIGINYDYYQASQDGIDLSTDMVSIGAEYRF